VQTPAPAVDECRRFYEQHPARFTVGELVFARHILFAVTSGVPVAALRSEAEQTLAELRSHPERFAEFARELSNCPSGQQDGNLGQLSPGECAPEFERAVFGSTATGVLPKLVNTRYGFHIIAIDGRVAGRLAPFDAVQETIAVHLAEEVARKALAQYVAVLAGDAQVQGVDLNAAVTPLLQ
jgi:peptidyl-prolyl cis-trans isomerase C